jgi:hypothetical protein
VKGNTTEEVNIEMKEPTRNEVREEEDEAGDVNDREEMKNPSPGRRDGESAVLGNNRRRIIIRPIK